MKVNVLLSPNGKKNLNDTLYDVIDTCVPGDVQKFGAKAAHWAFGIFGDDGTNALLSLAKPILENKAIDFFRENNIYATSKNLVLTKKGEELHGSIDIEDINYIKSITINRKRIIDGLKTLAPENVAWSVIGVLDNDTDNILKLILTTVDDKKKEKIIKLLISEFHSKICKAFTDFMSDCKINLIVNSISLA